MTPYLALLLLPAAAAIFFVVLRVGFGHLQYIAQLASRDCGWRIVIIIPRLAKGVPLADASEPLEELLPSDTDDNVLLSESCIRGRS